MKNILYIDCKYSGVAGDMFLAALYGLIDDKSILTRIKTYIHEYFSPVTLSDITIQNIYRNGVFVNHFLLKFDESHPELHVDEIQEHIPKMCDFLKLSTGAKKFAVHWFSILLNTERSVHTSSEPEDVHLHELGSIDTLIDICVGTAYLDKIGAFSIIKSFNLYCSPVAVGGGMVKIAHGTVMVPAPATEKIIQEYAIPIRGGPIEKELLTPTGAALIANLKELLGLQFCEYMPSMTIQQTGLSTGKLGDRDFPNILRVFLGIQKTNMQELAEDVVVLETMVDDCSGETLGIVMDYLYEAGALDVNYIGVQGKKNRPGVLIRVLSSDSNVDAIMSVLFTQLGTLGVRYRIEKRICLKRDILTQTMKIDNVSVTYHIKVAFKPSKPDELLFFKIEHNDIVRIAKELGKPLSIIRTKLESDFLESNFFPT